MIQTRAKLTSALQGSGTLCIGHLQVFSFHVTLVGSPFALAATLDPSSALMPHSLAAGLPRTAPLLKCTLRLFHSEKEVSSWEQQFPKRTTFIRKRKITAPYGIL